MFGLIVCVFMYLRVNTRVNNKHKVLHRHTLMPLCSRTTSVPLSQHISTNITKFGALCGCFSQQQTGWNLHSLYWFYSTCPHTKHGPFYSLCWSNISTVQRRWCILLFDLKWKNVPDRWAKWMHALKCW